MLKISHYDWSASNGPFNEIVGVKSEEIWVEMCNKSIAELISTNSAEAIGAESSAGSVIQTHVTCTSNLDPEENLIEKRKASADLINQLTMPSKRLCDSGSASTTKSAKLISCTKVESCRIEGQFYRYIPVSQIELPPKQRMLRNVDELFLSHLEANMEQDPHGASEPLFLLVKDIHNKQDFDNTKRNEYKYEVLGGMHNVLATKALLHKYPEQMAYNGRYAWVFVGLADDDALWLASRHNKTGSFRHEMTFQDEVNIAYQQLQGTGKKKGDQAIPSQIWRDNCSYILGKDKKALNEVFAVALLPKIGWELFEEICQKYEKGKLKEQRALPKDIKGKPTFRPVYIRCLHGLDVSDRIELLKKVANSSISLDELKVMSKELKVIRPVQKIISSFLGIKWEVIQNQLNEDVTPHQLHCFAGKDETNCNFKSYLDRLKQLIVGNKEAQDQSTSPNIFVTTTKRKGIVHKCEDPLMLEQSSYGQKEQGFSLAIYTLPEQLQEEILEAHVERVLGVVERMNFGVTQLYNIAILGTVEDIIKLKSWMVANRGSSIEVGYFNWNDGSTSSGNLGMINSVGAFLVYHAALGQKVVPEHFNFAEDKTVSNLVSVDGTSDKKHVFKKIVELFSHQDEWILDINSSQAAVVIAALTLKRNGLCIVTTDDAEFLAKKKLSELVKDK